MKTKLFSIFVCVLCFGCEKESYVSAVVKETRTTEVASEMLGCRVLVEVNEATREVEKGTNFVFVFHKWESCMINCSLLRVGDQFNIRKYDSYVTWNCIQHP